MPGLREVREQLLLAFDENIIDEEVFLLLYDVNRSSNPDFDYLSYNLFDFDVYPEAECYNELRFKKIDLKRLKNALHIPNEIVCTSYNNIRVDGLEALCIVLRRLCYPNRFADLIPRFGRPVPQLSMIFKQTLDFLILEWDHLLSDLNQTWLSPERLRFFADVIHAKGAPLDCVWGFIDGTLKACCRPMRNQRFVYNGHKRFHGLKYQSVSTPCGLIAHLYGPIEGKRHDSAMLALSGLLDQLQMFSHDQHGNILCLYGDPAYPMRRHLQAPFGGANLNNDEKAFNSAMSKVRVSVEWLFGDIFTKFKFNDFKKNLKIGLSPVGKLYKISALLTNANTCMYGNLTENYFDIDPPALEEYFL